MPMASPAKSFHPNDYGRYNMSGNVAEMVVADADVISKGGSFNSGGHDLRIMSRGEVRGPSSDLGFRVVFSVTSED